VSGTLEGDERKPKKPFTLHPKFKSTVYTAGGLTLLLYITIVFPQRLTAEEIKSNPTEIVQGCLIQDLKAEYPRGDDIFTATTSCGTYQTQSVEHLNSLMPYWTYTLEVSTGRHKYIVAAVPDEAPKRGNQ
jgi:hypothetical protein